MKLFLICVIVAFFGVAHGKSPTQQTSFIKLFCFFAGVPDPALPKLNFTIELSALKVRSKTLHDQTTALSNDLIQGGYRHLVDGLITQLGILWNLNYDLEHSTGQLSITEWNILSAAMTHREDRVKEELAIVREVQKQSSSGQLNWSRSDLDIKMNYQVIYEGVYKNPNNLYAFVRQQEDKHLTELSNKFKATGESLTGEPLKKMVEEFVRIYLSLDLIEKSRFAASSAKLQYNN